MGTLNLPNTLTVTRIVLIPVFVTAVIYRRYDYALYLFFIAALTDAFDGLIARLKNQKTAFGTFLDPLADKFLLVTSFVLFSIYSLIPTWFTITIISRDIIVITGWMLLHLATHTSKVEPSGTGKAAIALQLMLICFILLRLNFPSLPGIQRYLIWVTAFFTIISGLHYVYRGLKQANA
ncbi:MAG TPA: CDP-diacylglycerol--glycerol-3-phosphate 3-phosphatidyltransferase [Thermodesulfovibrionales bacterium]|nr:CDP-diacylglycerol--glycerol-3-phosphate 3-phosphatidyltransferase [Thermodesulfovibrionales bacterium]